MQNTHIADISFSEALSKAFTTQAEAESFVTSAEQSSSDTAKLIIHQAARFVWLADRMDDIAKGRPSLQILFYIIAAETVSKLFFDYHGERESRAHVVKFFNEFCSDQHRARLAKAFKNKRAFMTTDEAVNFLYDVRCDVAHRGNYYQLLLPGMPASGPMGSLLNMVDDEIIEAYISSSEIRQIIIEGSVQASRLLIQKQ